LSPQYERVIAALKAAGSRRQGNNWQCMAHDDQHPSLSVNLAADGSGWVLMHCHADCTPVETTAAIGLTVADLFPNGHRQLELFPKWRYSPVGIDVIRKTPSSAHRTLHVAGAIGRYVDRWGGRTHVGNTKQMLCVVLEKQHRTAVRDYLGLSPTALRNHIAQWRKWGVAHDCSTGLLTILVRDSEECPLCKASLIDDGSPAKASGMRDGRDPQASGIRDGSRHKSKATHPGFFKELDRDEWKNRYPIGDGSPKERVKR
jgi:hypothetical protein